MKIKIIVNKTKLKIWCLQLAPLCLSFEEIQDKDVDTKYLPMFILPWAETSTHIKVNGINPKPAEVGSIKSKHNKIKTVSGI